MLPALVLCSPAPRPQGPDILGRRSPAVPSCPRSPKQPGLRGRSSEERLQAEGPPRPHTALGNSPVPPLGEGPEGLSTSSQERPWPPPGVPDGAQGTPFGEEGKQAAQGCFPPGLPEDEAGTRSMCGPHSWREMGRERGARDPAAARLLGVMGGAPAPAS